MALMVNNRCTPVTHLPWVTTAQARMPVGMDVNAEVIILQTHTPDTILHSVPGRVLLESIQDPTDPT